MGRFSGAEKYDHIYQRWATGYLGVAQKGFTWLYVSIWHAYGFAGYLLIYSDS